MFLYNKWACREISPFIVPYPWLSMIYNDIRLWASTRQKSQKIDL